MVNTVKFPLLFLSCLLVLIVVGCGGGSGGGATYTSSTSAATGTATLSWTRATTYTDSSALTPAGYKVYYGTAHNTYTTVVPIPVANLTSAATPTYTVNRLPRGTYYFAVSVYDGSNVESALSTEVSKVIQ